MIILDMVWPALYVADEMWHLWYLIFLTIVIEAAVIKIMFKTKIGTSILISAVANIASGLAGVYVLPLVLILWHLLVDWFLNGTFNVFNWVATFILMFAGSVVLEVFIVRWFWKLDKRKLWIAMFWGNLLTYGLTAFLIISGKYYPSWKEDYQYSKASYSYELALKEDPGAVRYIPSKDTLKLLNDGYCVLDTIWIQRQYRTYRNSKDRENVGYDLVITFHQMPEKISETYLLEFLVDGDNTSPEIGRNIISLDNISDSMMMTVNQRNSDISIGWQSPVISDTIELYRLKK